MNDPNASGSLPDPLERQINNRRDPPREEDPTLTHETDPGPTPRPVTDEDIKKRRISMPARLVVVEQVHYQSDLETSVSCESRFDRLVASEEIPYSPPRVRIGHIPRLIEPGWIEGGCGTLHIRNDGPCEVHIQLNGLDPGETIFRIKPNESFRGQPDDLMKLLLCCPSGEALVKYTVFPE